MAILKRFEIWLLLILVVGLIVFAMNSEESVAEKPAVATTEPRSPVVSKTEEAPVETDSDQPVSTPPVEEPEIVGALRIDKVESVSIEQGMVIDLTLSGLSGEAESVQLDEKTLRVTDAKGDEVPRFFLPFETNPSLDADEISLVSLKFWLRDPSDTIWVNYRNQRLKAELPN